MPLPNSGTNRYIVSPDVVDNRDQAGGRLDYRLQRQAHDARPLPLEPHQRAQPRGSMQPADSLAIAKLWDVMVSDTYMFSAERDQPAPLHREQDRRPARGDLRPARTPTTASTCPTPTRWPSGLPSIAITGFPALGDSQQPFVQRNNDVYQFTDDFSLLRGKHSLKFGARRPQGAHAHRVHQPPERRLHLLAARSPATRSRTSCSALRRSSGRTTQQTIQDGAGWRTRATRRTSSASRIALTLNLGVRYEVATPFVEKDERDRGDQPGQAVDQVPGGAGGPPLSRRRGHSARRLRDRQEQRRAASRPRSGIRPARARPAFAPPGASSTTRSPARATSSRAACWRRRSRRCWS